VARKQKAPARTEALDMKNSAEPGLAEDIAST
jgi:hypothetical protein